MSLKNYQNLFSFALLIMPTALSGGGRGGGVVKCSLTFKVGYLIKRGAYFETRRSFNIALLISKSENVISSAVAMFTSYVSNPHTGWHCSQI